MSTKKPDPTTGAVDEGPLPTSLPSGAPSGVRGKAGKGRKRKSRPAGTLLAPQHKDGLWSLLDEKLGGREGLLVAAMASSNPKCQELVPYILDKNYKTWGTKKLADKVGLTAIEMGDLFRDQQWLKAYLAIHEQLPDVIQDAIVDAKASYEPCDVCKRATLTADCYVCQGKGVVRKAGDKDKLSFVGEVAGISGKKGPVVQFNQQLNVNNGGGGGNSFEDLMRKATMQPARRQIEAVEAERIEE